MQGAPTVVKPANVRSSVIAGGAYLLILVSIWGVFATNGMPAETAFAYMSDTSRSGSGFLYTADPLRIYTNVFYHFSYLLSGLFGILGSFVPYQFVYASLWWARGMLVFLIVPRLVPNSGILPFISGAFVLVHASDGALQWVGQMNQFGFMFWLLLGIYMLILALEDASMLRAWIYVAIACGLEYMCLWSYESALFIAFSAPLVLAFVLRPKRVTRFIALSTAWLVVPLTYSYEAYSKYFHATANTYQQSVLRHSWSLAGILSDLEYNIQYSLSFWSWIPKDSHMPQGEIYVLASGSLITFTLAGFMIIRSESAASRASLSIHNLYLWRTLASGIVLLILSFPAYLLLESARTTWRTQFLSGIGAAMIWGSALCIVAGLLPQERLRPIFVIILAIPLVWTGTIRAIEAGGFERLIWQRHQKAMQEIVRAAPQVEAGTVIVMTGVPKAADPFGDGYWFDMALRLSYPRTFVAGVFYYDNRTAASGDNLRLQGDRWTWDGTGAPPLIRSAGVGQTLVIEYEAQGPAKVLPSIPSFVCTGQCYEQEYDPARRITGRTPSGEARWRYGPL